MTRKPILILMLALLTFAACDKNWCAHEAKAYAVAHAVLPALSSLAPDKAAILSVSLETAHAGVAAIGCDGYGDETVLGERVARVADLAVQALMLYGQLRGREIGIPPITEQERLEAIAELTKLQAAIARERGRGRER